MSGGLCCDAMTEQPTSRTPPSPTDAPETDSRWRTSLLVPVVIIAIVIGLIGGIILVAQQEGREGEAALGGTGVVPGPLPVTVPYREVAGHVVIDVSLGGSEPMPMVLDSGGPTIVSAEVAEVFGGGRVGTVTAGSADGQVVTSDVVELPAVAIGGARFEGVGAVVGAIEPGNPLYCISQHGLIGASLMQAATWQIDPAAQTVTIASSIDGLEHVDGVQRFEFRRASAISPSPLVALSAGEGTLNTLVDTGAVDWLAFNPLELEDIGVALALDAPSIASRDRATMRWGWADLSGAGGSTSLPVASSMTVPRGQGTAGTDYLSRFVVTIDWEDEVLYLDPIAPLSPPPPASATLGWADGYVVRSYVVGLPGNAGLELGAPVTAIDGVDVTRARFADFCARLVAGAAATEMKVGGETPVTVEVSPVEGFYDSRAPG